MAKRVAGTCYFKVDGSQLEVSGGVEVSATSVVRETIMGLTGVAGYKETARKPSVKVTAIFRDDLPLAAITNGTNMTITVEMPNGKTFTLSGAYLVGEPTAKADDGTMDLEFEGMKGIWQ